MTVPSPTTDSDQIQIATVLRAVSGYLASESVGTKFLKTKWANDRFTVSFFSDDPELGKMNKAFDECIAKNSRKKVQTLISNKTRDDAHLPIHVSQLREKYLTNGKPSLDLIWSEMLEIAQSYDGIEFSGKIKNSESRRYAKSKKLEQESPQKGFIRYQVLDLRANCSEDRKTIELSANLTVYMRRMSSRSWTVNRSTGEEDTIANRCYLAFKKKFKKD